MGAMYFVWTVLTGAMLLVYFNTPFEERKVNLHYFEYSGKLPDELPSL